MFVQSLGAELLRQITPRALAPLQLGPLVLEPDLDLAGPDAQLLGQGIPPGLCEVAAVLKLDVEPPQLVPVEGGPRSLLALFLGCCSLQLCCKACGSLTPFVPWP